MDFATFLMLNKKPILFPQSDIANLIFNPVGINFSHAMPQRDDFIEEVKCHAVILACGGFEANKSMRKKYLGGSWAKMKVRGTKYNTGKGLGAALSIGAKRYGIGVVGMRFL